MRLNIPGVKVLLTAAALVACSATATRAAATGSISGVVRMEDGSFVPGATVSVSGSPLPAGQSEVTGADGGFSFFRLPPGPYQIRAELSGMGLAEKPVIVAVERDTQVSLLLAAQLEEEITVSAAAPQIDRKASEAGVNFTRETIENLPLPRTYVGLVQLAPGVADNGSNRTAPNAGGSRLDNTFLLDGTNITNPHFGDIFPNVPEIDIDEVNLKRGGITAEFGRTGGMVVNAVTRSGSNDFHGEARVELQPSDWVADSKQTLQEAVDRQALALSLGGPILRDRLWFYGSASRPQATATDRRNNLGAVPDRTTDTDEYFLKLTANPLAQHLVSAAIRSRDTTTENAGITASNHPSTASDDSTDVFLGHLSWTWNINSRSFAEARYSRSEEDNGTDPVTDLGYRPTFNAARPDLVGRFTTTADRIIGGATGIGQIVGGADLAINNQDFQRDELRVAWQTNANWFGQSHDLRAGVVFEEDSERLERRANGWGTITWNASTQLFTASYNSQQPPHTGRGESQGVFVQDQFTLGSRATITAGALVNRDVYFGEALGATPGTKTKKKILTFDWDQQIQPRLGIAFVPSMNLGDKLYLSLGRYYNTDNKSLVRAASPTRLFTTRATFNAAGTLISDVPAANTQTKTVDGGLDPQYTDEFVLGYARPLSNSWSVEGWGMYREVGDIMEDVSRDGLGNGPFRVAQLPHAYREYTALTLQAVRRPADASWWHLSVNASYTWSRLEGNWDIDFGANSPFLNSSFIQDGPGVLITDNRDGILRGDREHVLKVFSTIRPWQGGNVGTAIRFQSGGAWEARGLPDANVSSSSHFRYLERAGSRRMDDWLNVDFLVSHEFLFGSFGLELEARVLNAFDEQVELEVDDRLIVGRPTPLVPNNPDFGRGTVFSAPRAFVISAILRR